MNFTIQTTDIPTIISTMFKARRVPYFVGKPGVGKTAMVRDAAAALSVAAGAHYEVVEVHLASMSEVDVRGFLIPDGADSRFTKPPFWSTIDANPNGILFLDEFPQAAHEVQKAVAPLLLDRRIGDFVLPEGWHVVLAGNSTEDNAGANTLLSHVLNRLCYIKVFAPDPDKWVIWAAKQGLPPELLALAKLRPGVMFDAPLPAADDTPYCTPRSVHALGDIANQYPGGLRAMVTEPLGMAMIAGLVGDGAAAEIAGLVRTTMKLPSFEEICKDPKGTRIPEAMDEAYAALMLCAVRADPTKHPQAMEYVLRFQPNFALVGVVAMVNRDYAFANNASLGKWIEANRELLTKFHQFIKIR